MTFNEAVEFKNSQQSPYDKSGVTMNVYVTPTKKEDFHNFLSFYKINKLDDESAKLFCSDENYSVYGLGPRIEYLLYHKLS